MAVYIYFQIVIKLIISRAGEIQINKINVNIKLLNK